MMDDVTILYQGGSGGFAIYYYLLLSGRYQYDIDTVQSMIAQQFPSELATTPSKWKNKEFWPNNPELKKNCSPTVFLICNPLFNPEMYKVNQQISLDTHRILLYTDIHLQLRMAYEKQAYWFTPVSRQYFNAPVSNKQYIRQVINSSKPYSNNQVDTTVLEIVNKFKPDLIVDLTTFIESGTLDNFPMPTQDQLDFLKYWKSLQPAKAKIY
jgi:hypothetical protein